jgi:peroxiredoxin Q/BCP
MGRGYPPAMTPFGLRRIVKNALGLAGKSPLKPGDAAPSLDVADATGKCWSLSELRGRKAVIYFYPKDDTPGCTREACDFRDQHATLDAVVLGVSGDDAQSHTAFAHKFNLAFPLLADTDGALASRYGCWSDGAARRATFVLDREGRISHVFDPVKVDGHVGEVKAALNALP